MKPVLKKASACLALLVPRWVVHMHERVGICQSIHYGVDIGVGQRRSHMVLLPVYIQQLVSKLSIRDWLSIANSLLRTVIHSFMCCCIGLPRV